MQWGKNPAEQRIIRFYVLYIYYIHWLQFFIRVYKVRIFIMSEHKAEINDLWTFFKSCCKW